ncbi:hypothetical protein DTO027B9_5945 [Paecilomyces variotii]|nr:hypothetical protein DTO027B9_5945 [Paecilomyces variotii]
MSAPGENHLAFTEWVISQGVKINGVAPARFPGRGLGMIATRDIEEGEIMVQVPLKAMYTIDSIPPSFVNKFLDGISVHGLLAAFLAHGDPNLLEKYTLWQAVWPTRQDFADSMPLLWPEHLRSPSSSTLSPTPEVLLPPSISGQWNTIRKKTLDEPYKTSHQNLLPEMEKRFQDAWDSVRAVFPDTDRETYLYFWLIVNTRSFYYLMPDEEPPEDNNDAMALVPFADYFNHSDEACDVVFDGEAYTFRATKHYDKGEEIYMSYGPHPNDFLLTEYGFYLPTNNSDAIYLDDIIFRDLNASSIEQLKLHQYYGNYQLTPAGPCFRTEVAACLKYLPAKDWRSYVQGQSTRGVSPKKTSTVVRAWIGRYRKEAEETIGILERRIENEKKGGESKEDREKLDVVLGRWRQIRGLCESALESMR